MQLKETNYCLQDQLKAQNRIQMYQDLPEPTPTIPLNYGHRQPKIDFSV